MRGWKRERVLVWKEVEVLEREKKSKNEAVDDICGVGREKESCIGKKLRYWKWKRRVRMKPWMLYMSLE